MIKLVKKALKKATMTQSDLCFTWMDAYTPVIPNTLKVYIEEKSK